MKKALIITLIVLGALVFVGLLLIGWIVGIFNGFVSADEQVAAAWADVQSAYQRRFDLIPNLVETVLGAANFEQETFTQVTALRSGAIAAREDFQSAQAAGDVQGQIAAANELDGIARTFSGLNINVENYPSLGATQNFADLQVQLEGTENRINVARDRYNEQVRIYNTQVRQLPNAFFAGIFGFEVKEPFEADQGAEQAPQVNFS